jgi:hypothetical protein
MASAQETIKKLKADGMSYSEIGRKLGRDSSLISQIARGKKKGANLEGALDAIKEKKPMVPTPERRVNKKTGKPQSLRKSKATAKPARLLKDKFGRIKFAPMTEKAGVFERRLETIGRDGGRVSFRVRFEDGTEKLLFKSGIWAQQALRQIGKHGGGAFAWLSEQAETNQGYNQEDLGDVIAVEILATYGN